MKKITLVLILLTTSLGFSQTPGAAAPTPPVRDAGDVISIFSEAYTPITGVSLDPNWGQTTDATEVMIAGNNTLSYATFNYQGTDWAGNPQNISSMEFLHVDVWTNNEAPNVYVISSGAEVAHAISTDAGSWQSIDIAVAGITGDITNTIQFKFDGGAGGTIYLDNLYFYRSPPNPLKDATLSDLKVDGATISSFGSGTTDYTYEVANGTVIIPQITAVTTTNGGASTSITQATAIPGDATIEVTSADDSTTKTYTVSIVATGPPSAAPTPPARNASDVISLFSNAYNDITINTWSAVWDDSNVEDVQIAGNDTKKITFTNFIGVEFQSSRFDATSFTHFHIDIFTDTPTLDKSFNLKFSNWAGGAGEANAIEFSTTNASSPALSNPNPGTWISLDMPLSSWTPGARQDLVQFLITSNLGIVYVDNIYVYKGTPLGLNDFDLVSFKVYPNPARDSWTIRTKNEDMSSIQIFDILGKNVLSLTPNASEVKIDASSLTTGLYFAQIKTSTGVNSVKLVKQ